MSAEENGLKGEDWAGDRGEKWLANLGLLEGMIAPIGAALIEAIGPKRGEAVLDIGCGGGATTVALAPLVAPEGTVTGLDISPVLAKAALERAEAEGHLNVSMINADAARVKLQPRAYDIITSRFGVMFFDDPVAAFKNLRRALKEDGRLCIAVWAPPSENEWASLVIGGLSKHMVLPARDPKAPGPFAFGNQEYLHEILKSAGFENIMIDEWTGVHHLGGNGATPQAAADFVLSSMSIGDLIRVQPEATVNAIRNEVTNAFAPHATPDGVALRAKSWFVTAH
ncbi:MAG: class I SAM-dependent methyltransferase [Parvularculaceae bacterium]